LKDYNQASFSNTQILAGREYLYFEIYFYYSKNDHRSIYDLLPLAEELLTQHLVKTQLKGSGDLYTLINWFLFENVNLELLRKWMRYYFQVPESDQHLYQLVINRLIYTLMAFQQGDEEEFARRLKDTYSWLNSHDSLQSFEKLCLQMLREVLRANSREETRQALINFRDALAAFHQTQTHVFVHHPIRTLPLQRWLEQQIQQL
jgi:hypothetical protein